MKCQREKFNLQRKYTYLNCAYMSPLLKKVENAGIKGIKRKRKPFHISPDDFFKEAGTIRLLFSELINNAEPNRVCIIPSTSYGMANVTNNLPVKDGKILLLDEQFPSNVYPWLALKEKGFKVDFVKAPNSESKGASWNEKIIESIDAETRVVAMGHIHWADGTLFNLKAIRKKLDEVGGLLVIDGTQSVGALPFDVQEIKPDALICSAYKWLMGPYSIGLAYYGEKFDHGFPIENSWLNRKNSEDFAGLVSYEGSYKDLALRYEVGEHGNFVLTPMLHEALKQLLKWGAANVQSYCKELIADAVSEAQMLGYQMESEAYRSNHLFGMSYTGVSSKERLIQSFKKNKIEVGFRGSSLRISPHVYNDEIDMRKLVNALKEAIFTS